MRPLRWLVAKNALSNVVRGGATAIVAVALPHFLAHNLDTDRFAAWSLILQIAAYASVLDFGLQTAVARFIAQAIELEQHDHIRKLIETALAMLSLAAVAALTIVGLVVLYAGQLFHGVPLTLLHEFQIATMIMAIGAAVALPLSTFTGVLIGLHKNELPALAIGGSRLIGAAIAIVAARHTHSLVVIASCVAIPNVAGGLLQVVFAARNLQGIRIVRAWMDRAVAAGFLRYCAGLAVWSFGMLLISGLDVTIVGHFQFEAVGYYAVAATMMTLFASANSSVLSSLLAPFATMQAKGEFEKMRGIVIRSTRLSTLLNVASTALIIAYGQQLLRVWVGVSYARQAYPILVVLTITQAIRLAASGYSIALIATGHQNSGIVPAIIEASVNLVASVWGMIHFGPMGVAYGSLLGAIVAIPSLLFFSVRVREDLRVSRIDLFMNGMLLGALPALPAIVCACYIQWHNTPPALASGLWLASIGSGVFLFSRLSTRRQARDS
jgi:O-antigen/teichoic acid export membrane protein